MTHGLQFAKLEPNKIGEFPIATEEQNLPFSNSQFKQMERLIRYRMPFGKYQNMRLLELPEPYVVWFSKKGFPQGELGEMLAIVHVIKVNGLEYLFKDMPI